MSAHRVVPTVKFCLICKKEFECGGRGRRSLNAEYCSKTCSAMGRMRQPTILHLRIEDVAYIAGLFDGEGSVTTYDRGFGGRVQLRCSIVNTYLPILDWLLVTTGTGTLVKHKVYSDKHKECKTWQCYGQNAKNLLEQMLPYLIIKRDRAISAIASQEVVRC
jgi:hypothetical protein